MALSTPVSQGGHVYPLSTSEGLTAINDVKMSTTVYRGKRCLLLTETNDPQFGVLGTVLPGDFENGTIEFDATAQLTPLHNPTSRGFVGIGFHASHDLQKYDSFYLRMTNGRSSNQELRNHAVQYCMCPEHLWDQLRAYTPSRYETYSDLELGAWTHIRISIHDKEAKFYVGDAKQPTLVVHDLFMGGTRGRIGLWVGGLTKAYFANFRVREE